MTLNNRQMECNKTAWIIEFEKHCINLLLPEQL